MTLAVIGQAIWKFLKSLPGWVWWVVLAVLTATFIDMRARGQQRAKDKAEFDKEAAAVESEVISNINENTDEVIRKSDAVRSRPAIVELPDGTSGLPDYHYRD